MIRFVHERLQANPLTLFDVGAKGGAIELPKLAPYSKCFAFEPNPDEFNKLIHSSRHANYAQLAHFEVALHDKTGTAELNITNRASFASLFDLNEEVFKRHQGSMLMYESWVEDFIPVKKREVRTITGKDFCREHGIDRIDFLKLDTQGNELHILRGCEDYIHKTGIIKCEVNFAPVYHNQHVFSEIDLFLRDNGFEFVDCRFYETGVQETPSRKRKNKIYDRPRFATGGDAYYMSIVNPSDDWSLLKNGLVLAELGYLSEAYDCLSNYPHLTKDQVDVVIKDLSAKSVKAKVRNFMKNWIPPKLLWILKNLNR